MSSLEEALRHAEEKLSAKDADVLKAVADAYAYLTELVEDKNTSIAKLRKMLFGDRTEKTAAVVGSSSPSESSPPPRSDAGASDAAAQSSSIALPDSETNDSLTAAKGHGRNGADDYPGAERIEVPLASFTAGDQCPKCEDGTIYQSRPGVLVRLTGQPPIGAKIYYLQKLRCNLCGAVFSAEAPACACTEKYDATAGSMIALLKYGTGMPFNRTENLQQGLGTPAGLDAMGHRGGAGRARRTGLRGTRAASGPR
jgi:transposase